MKKVLVIALALFTFTGFAQQIKKEGMNDAMKDRLTKRGQMNPEKRAQIQTKKMALTLDLSEKQQTQVEATLLEHYLEGQKKMDANKKPKKELTEDERHAMLTDRLDAQIALKEKMKNILNDDQYAKYSQMMNRRLQKSKGNNKGPKMKKG